MQSFRGFFINLDRNQDRLAHMNRQLTEAGLSQFYTRVPAVEGASLGPEYQTRLDRGNLGLWLTHERLIQANLNSDVHIHILEDDAQLPKDAAAAIAGILETCDQHYPIWDILFTEIYLQMGLPTFRMLVAGKQAYKSDGRIGLASLKPIAFAGTSSIIINKRSLDKYLKLISGNWKIGEPIDLVLRQLVHGGALNAMVTVPFVTTLAPQTAASDIRGQLDASHLVLNVYRRAAFKDADIPALMAEIDELLKGVEVTGFSEIYLKVLKHCLSEKHVEF